MRLIRINRLENSHLTHEDVENFRRRVAEMSKPNWRNTFRHLRNRLTHCYRKK